MKQVITIKLRLRDKHSAALNRKARAVNFVWNYCNETQMKAAQFGRKWLTWVDLVNLTTGSSKMLDLPSRSIDQICIHYDRSRRVRGRPWLRWRGRRSLGWIPINTGNVRFDGVGFVYYGTRYEAMHHREHIKPGVFPASSFNRDSKGRWYINLPVEVDCTDQCQATRAGIDLGLKHLVTVSDGRRIEMPRFYRSSEAALATSQRARKTRRARSIHRKIANRRNDFLHKASSALVKEYGLIVIGDVSASKLAQTKMAKSVLDAGWSDFKQMLSYKAIMHGGRVVEVSEHMTTQTCSECGNQPASRPRGIAGLGIREWRCDDCGAVHDRDVNAARNILRLGLETLAEGAAQMRSSQYRRRQQCRMT